MQTTPDKQVSRSPRIDVLQELLSIYTLDELRTLLKHSEEVKGRGWGRLTIVFNGAHKRRIEVTNSYDLE